MIARRSLALVLSAGALGSAAFADGLAGEPSPRALYLRAGTVDTAAPAPALASSLGAIAKGERIVVQLDGPITPARRAALAAAGVRLGDYLPMYAYLATVDGASAKAVAGLPFVRWWSRYQTAWKLDPEIGKRPYATRERLAMAAAGRDLLVVSAFPGADTGALEKTIWALPGAAVTTEEAIGDHVEITVSMPLAGVPALAASPAVQFIEPAPDVTPRNVGTRWIVQSNVTNNWPLYAAGIHGENQVLGLLDDGFNPAHCSFSDTNPIGPTHRKILAINGSVSSTLHGTHTAGIAVGDAGVDTADTRGNAYLAKMVFAHWPSFDETGMNTALSLHHSQTARMHSNSWGDDGTTSYTSLCRGIDVFSYNNEEDLVLFAVSNGSIVTTPENAKNCVGVGAVGDAGSQATICYGGTGPTADGRRKPEIFAPGCSIQSSSYSTACSTTALSGTSMACPAVTAVGLLVRQYFTAGYYPTGIAGGAPSMTPSGALVKAVILNSGSDITSASGYPTNAEGWGRVTAANALYFPGSARKLLVPADVRNSGGLATGGETDYNVNVLGSGQQLRVTLVWTEPPATVGAAAATVNDLDLEVVAPDSSVYKGNVFNTTTQQSITGGAKDAKNNVEQVHLASPAAGAWTVRVKGGNVASGLQGYALVVTGDIQGGTPPPLSISLAGPVPSLVPPGVTWSLPVTVTPGTQNVVPGSPQVFYRSSVAGSFVPSPLVALGGTSYRADFAAPQCADTPQFYFSAQGDGGATVTLPGNAPAGFLGTTVGTVSTTSVYQESFESGLPSGWTAGGLWHTSSGCAPGGTCDGTSWAYYGQEGVCNFNTGATTTGLLTSAPISLPGVPAGGTITLTYCSAKQSENNANYDRTTVLVNGATVVDTAGEAASFETRTADLTAYAGQAITLTWKFDSVDATLNNYRGWHVDNVRISATSTGCTNPPPACYANCDASTTAPALNALDFTCFLQKYAAGDAYANCDGSTVQPTLNVADFSCFLGRYAAGCP